MAKPFRVWLAATSSGSFGGLIWDIPNDTQPTLTLTGGLQSGLNISSFRQGNDGEMYLIEHATRKLQRINFQGGGGGGTGSRDVERDRLRERVDRDEPARGLIPYAPNAPFWSDGADKDRWMALPNGTSITIAADGDWDFPNRTVLMKNFRLGQRLIETRLLMRHPDGEWAGYTYEWNAPQTAATRVQAAAPRQYGGQSGSPERIPMPAVSHRRRGKEPRARDSAAANMRTRKPTAIAHQS